MLIGLGLFLGVFARYAATAGVVLLTLYYFAYPPFGLSLFSNPEGQLYIVNKNFIEAMALLLLVFSKQRGYGVDNLLSLVARKNEAKPNQQQVINIRREALKNIVTLPVLGLLGWGAFRESKNYGVDVMSGATIQVNQMALTEVKGELPKGKIGNHEISRLVLGGNLIGVGHMQGT